MMKIRIKGSLDEKLPSDGVLERESREEQSRKERRIAKSRVECCWCLENVCEKLSSRTVAKRVVEKCFMETCCEECAGEVLHRQVLGRVWWRSVVEKCCAEILGRVW